jgi:hypothetical protein
VSFSGFDCFLLFVVVGGRNKLGSSFLTLVITPLKDNTQFVCGFGCTLLNSTQVILNYFLTYNNSLKTSSQIGNLMFQLCILFGSIKTLTLERTTHYARRSQNSVARSMIKSVIKIFNLNGSNLQIRSKQRVTRVSTKQCGMSFKLSELQPCTIKQTCNMRMQ